MGMAMACASSDRGAGGSGKGAVGETRYAPLAVLNAWFTMARPGDAATIYAIGPALNPREPVAELVARWIKGGEVTAFKTRSMAGELLHHVRRAAQLSEAAPISAVAAAAAITALPAKAERMLGVLAELAEASAACPSWASLGDLADLRDGDAARYQCRLLEGAGLISISTDGHARVVTITASGKATASAGRA